MPPDDDLLQFLGALESPDARQEVGLLVPGSDEGRVLLDRGEYRALMRQGIQGEAGPGLQAKLYILTGLALFAHLEISGGRIEKHEIIQRELTRRIQG